MPATKTERENERPLTTEDWEEAKKKQEIKFRERLEKISSQPAAWRPAGAAQRLLAGEARRLPDPLLNHPSLHGWLFAAEHAPPEPDPAEVEVLSQAAGFACSLALLSGRTFATQALLDRKGHFHLYGTRAYLDFGPDGAQRKVGVSVNGNGLTVRNNGTKTTAPREKILEGIKKIVPGLQAPGLVGYPGLSIRWNPAVSLGTEVAPCDPILTFPLRPGIGAYDHAPADLGPKALDRFVSVLREGYARAGDADPELGRSLSNTIRALAPLKRDDPRRHVSSTFSHLRGAVFLCHDEDPLLQAETLVHEASHNQLHTLQELGPLFEAGHEDAVYYSPWRVDPRPLPGILLGAHAFLAVARLLAAAAGAAESSARQERFENAAYRCLQVETALGAVERHARLAVLGSRLMAGLKADLAALRKALPPPPGGIWGAAAEAAGPHRLRYLRPGTFLHLEAGAR